jgi:hypothetical protein
MKSITIHGMEEPLAALIKARAEAEGLSLNQTIKNLLEEALGMKVNSSGRHREDFERFCGCWTKKDLAEFEKTQKPFEKVDPEDWQ